jgi:hypothetical protein
MGMNVNTVFRRDGDLMCEKREVTDERVFSGVQASCGGSSPVVSATILDWERWYFLR